MSNLINKETGFEIATTPEKLPPLRNGYMRLIHQTSFNCAESLAENGLIYNRDLAQKDGFSKYSDVTSMSYAYTENGFWERLTEENIRHKGANAIAIFDMPMEELGAHQKYYIADYLNGTISRGYMVGIIPNYGTKDNTISEKLSVQEMEEKRRISKQNPLPPHYETPNWRENIEKAWNKFYDKGNEAVELFGHNFDRNITNNNDEDTTTFVNQGYSDWVDWEELNYENIKPTTEDTNKSMNEDPLQLRLQNIRQRLAANGLEGDMGKTGDSRTGEISEKHKRVAQIQTETAKTSSTRFSQVTRNR